MVLNPLIINRSLYEKDEKNEIQRYKAYLVAHGFSQRPVVNYEETYSSIMDAIILCYPISFMVHERFKLHMNMVTIYFYGLRDNEIYIKTLKDLRYPKHIVQNLKRCIQLGCKDHRMI